MSESERTGRCLLCDNPADLGVVMIRRADRDQLVAMIPQKLPETPGAFTQSFEHHYVRMPRPVGPHVATRMVRPGVYIYAVCEVCFRSSPNPDVAEQNLRSLGVL